jgi:CubicO group peptidase (beta-lactamase class C family)
MKQIEWDTRFFSLFPELESPSHPEYQHITIENLLTCTAGIQPFTNLAQEEFPTFPENSDEKHEFARYLLNQKSLAPYKKGKFGFLYSNASYTLASMMLEKVSEMTYDELIDKFINNELKITTSPASPTSTTPISRGDT